MEVFTFGKYKGYNVNSVIEFNPDYVRWAEKNVSFFTLTDEQKEKISQAEKYFKLPRIYDYDDDFEDIFYDDFEDDLRACFDPNQ